MHLEQLHDLSIPVLYNQWGDRSPNSAVFTAVSAAAAAAASGAADNAAIARAAAATVSEI